MQDIIANWPGKRDQNGATHPAVYHMLDVAAVAEILLARTPYPAPLRQALCLLTALHDLGKIGAPFRNMLSERIPQAKRHWEMTEVLLHRHDALLAERLGGRQTRRAFLYAATAGHHGRPPTLGLADTRHLRAMGDDAIRDSAEVIRAFAALWPEASLDALSREDAIALSWWLPGCIAAADWIGSNEGWFPFAAPDLSIKDYLDTARAQAVIAVQAAGLHAPAPSTATLFDFDPRPMQAAVADIPLPDGPMLAVIEDETGAGKTEAALLLAQRMIQAGKGQGLYVALPTMATANAMFLRVRDVVGRMFASAPCLTLAHGRAGMSDAFRDLVAQPAPATDAPVSTEWLADNRRRALLATVGVGTIDQALLSVLPTKHACLRHYGLSSKILIVDEVHEMGEPYLSEELAQLLTAHRQAGGSAILLTATLPLDQRAALLARYGGRDEGDPAYPALTIAGGTAQRAFDPSPSLRGPITVDRVASAEDAVALLTDRAAQGAACVWVRNAVDDAISAVNALRAAGVQADLLHARFAMVDRLAHETAALTRFGKTGQDRAGRVLVATQVVESSLDLDFDVMVSDLAPVAALIQRAGRLWRHMDERPVGARPVPSPVLSVVGPDPEDVRDDQWLARVLDRGAWVYPLDLQWRTARALAQRGEIVAPGGLRDLIEEVHGAGDLPMPVPDALAPAERERIGKGYAAQNRARHNLVKLEEGYRDGGAGAEDTEFPTRLGLPTRTLMLAVWQDGGLVPYAGGGVDGCQLSEVRASEHRLSGLDLPDQTAPEIVALTQDWPDWRRRTLTVCPMDDAGQICDGLLYDPALGLLFSDKKS
ncbi:CRISPR-associated helicase Cas3' [Aliiroseovarius crassostreae]|nr:CRISPR-associated helicase Cas3' [Aliiroseovarius crassostreae]